MTDAFFLFSICFVNVKSCAVINESCFGFLGSAATILKAKSKTFYGGL